MIDFVKLNINSPDLQSIRNNSYLVWEQTTNESTGEITEQKAFFHGMKLLIKNDKYLMVSGSLHKYWNSIVFGENHNYNDFGFNSVLSAIDDFCSNFSIDPSSCRLHNLEFGVNLIPQIPANEVLKSVIDHKGKPFTLQYADGKRFRECIHQRYIIKVYNKGIQYGRDENILRFEIKTMKMEHLKSIGISNLKDLCDPKKCEKLGKNLVFTFKEILFYDYSINLDTLPKKESNILSLGISPGYWSSIKDGNISTYKKQRKMFRDLVHEFGSNTIQESIGEEIERKWQELSFKIDTPTQPWNCLSAS